MQGINIKSAILSGVIAGFIFVILEMIMVPLFAGGSPWGPPRMIAAVILGSEVLPPPATFEPGMMLVAILVHLSLSIIFGLILAAFIHQLNMARSIYFGLAFGIVLYIINFYIFTEFFPWFVNARNWITVFSHAVFGLTAGWMYYKMKSHATAGA